MMLSLAWMDTGNWFKGTGSGTGWMVLCHLLVVWPWANHLPCLCHSFFLGKNGHNNRPTVYFCCEHSLKHLDECWAQGECSRNVCDHDLALDAASIKCFALISRNTLAMSGDFQVLLGYIKTNSPCPKGHCQPQPPTPRVSFWRSNDIHKACGANTRLIGRTNRTTHALCSWNMGYEEQGLGN